MTSVEFIGLLNFRLPFYEPYHSDDVPLMTHFEKIGIAAGAPFDAEQLDPIIRKAMEEGQQVAIKKIAEKVENMGEKVNGWNMTDACGAREFFKGDWLLRAAAAPAAMYMIYPLVFVDANGDTLDGKVNQYILHFEKDEIPPAKYFWSVTMYDKSPDDTAGCMVANPINRSLINSTTEGLIYEEEGSLSIYIQYEQPEGEKAANWLPAPAEPFYMALRIYGPEESVMAGEWAPPAVQKVKSSSKRSHSIFYF